MKVKPKYHKQPKVKYYSIVKMNQNSYGIPKTIEELGFQVKLTQRIWSIISPIFK